MFTILGSINLLRGENMNISSLRLYDTSLFTTKKSREIQSFFEKEVSEKEFSLFQQESAKLATGIVLSSD